MTRRIAFCAYQNIAVQNRRMKWKRSKKGGGDSSSNKQKDGSSSNTGTRAASPTESSDGKSQAGSSNHSTQHGTLGPENKSDNYGRRSPEASCVSSKKSQQQLALNGKDAVIELSSMQQAAAWSRLNLECGKSLGASAPTVNPITAKQLSQRTTFQDPFYRPYVS